MIEKSERPLRLLIVENEVLITVLLHDALRGAGLVVVGPAFNLRQAEHLACCCDIDGALLDIYLDSGESTLSVATILHGRGIPFIFITGGTLDDVPRFEEVPILRKPISTAEIIRAARNHFGRGTPAAAPVLPTSATATITVTAPTPVA